MTTYSTFVPPTAGSPADATVTRSGAKPTPIAAPADPALWVEPLASAATMKPGVQISLTPDAAVASDPVVVEAVVELGGYGSFLRVDNWLDVRMHGSGAALGIGIHASLGGEQLRIDGDASAAMVTGAWARVQVVISADQLAVLVAGIVMVRVPLAAQFVPPSPVKVIRLGTRSGAPSLKAALLAIGDDLPVVVSSALEAAEVAGVGEVTGAFLRVGGKAELGDPTGAEQILPAARFQPYVEGAIYHTARVGAVALHGPIYDRYAALNAHNGPLGLPLTDVQCGTAPYGTRDRNAPPSKKRDKSTMVRFENGIIASSPDTGTAEVMGNIAKHWLLIGGPASPVGLPVGALEESRHGWRFHFQFGDIYERFDHGCAEVHGAILDRYEALGSWEGDLGVPVTDETVVCDANRNATAARLSVFEHGVIYWSPTTHARALPQAWAEAYLAQGGPAGKLGLPRSEVKMAGPVEFVEFQSGFMVNHAAAPFQVIDHVAVTLVSADAPDIDDGVEFLGEDRDAELISWVTVRSGNSPEPGWDHKRFPSSGHTGKSLSYGSKTVNVAVTPSTKVTVKFETEDWDAISGNDQLGGHSATYGIDTLWGELGPTGSAKVETGKGGDGDVTYRYIMGLPEPPLTGPFRKDRWWQFINAGTDDIGYPLYAETFEDVEAHHNWWDTVNNPLDHLFYELAVKNIAEKGNCFGLSTEGHRANFRTNVFRMPLEKFGPAKTKLDTTGFPGWLRSEMNKGQMHQLGGAVIGTLLARIADLSLWNAVTVANRLAAAIRGGDLPLVSMQESGFEGGHAVLAYGLQPRGGGHPDTILVADPNVPWASNPDENASKIIVDSNGAWKFINNGADSTKYRGDLGAMFFDVPGCVLRSPTITPMAEIGIAVQSLLSSLVMMAGDTADELIRPMGGNASLQRVPLYEGTPQRRLYASNGSVPPSGFNTVIVPHGNVQFGMYARTANHAAGMTLKFADSNSIGKINIDRFDTVRPRLVAEIDQKPTTAKVHLASQFGRAHRHGWAVEADVLVSGDAPFSIGFSTVGAGIELEGTAKGKAPTVTLKPLDGSLASKFQLTGMKAGARVELRPADMASPFGSQRLIGLGNDILLDPT